jgi:Ca2+-binding RTX toxin-like protein
LFKKNFVLGSEFLGILTIVGITVLTQNLAWAASISCVGSIGFCLGTTGDDIINGGGAGEIIDGLTGNDIINAGGGDDDVCGGGGDDKIHGGNGNDRLIGDALLCKTTGDPGSDKITGGPGNDILTHNHAWETGPDGHKDFVDCGPGDDTVYVNTSVDQDQVATNCEHVNAG